MDFKTVVNISEQKPLFDYRQQYFFIGSCFTENISNKLSRYGFNLFVNPFGILYNPFSIAQCISYLVGNEKIKENDLVYHQELWHSIYHHGSFSSTDKKECLQNCNLQIEKGHESLKNADLLILTLGSAYVYKLKSMQKIVGNCHKLPSKEFDKFLLDLEDIIKVYQKLFDKLHHFNPKLHILFTVSPVRHLKDGFHENQLSKSVLHLLIKKLLQHPQISYFPAYEIVMDELRDYRFYERDMVHPNSVSIDYIWERFSTTIFDKETLQMIENVEQLKRMQEHRPFNTGTQAWNSHQEKTRRLLDKIRQLYPALNLDY